MITLELSVSNNHLGNQNICMYIKDTLSICLYILTISLPFHRFSYQIPAAFDIVFFLAYSLGVHLTV